MNKVYFEIEEKKLYLDYMLEIYDNIPMFYVCKTNDNERYLVLCSDFDDESYLIIKVSLEDLSNMLNGKTDIRSTFLDQKEFWDVKCSQSGYSHDKITKNNIDCFPSEYLPKKDEYYVLYDKEHSDYAMKIDNELEKTWSNIELGEVEDIAIDTNIDLEAYRLFSEQIRKIDYLDNYEEISISNIEEHDYSYVNSDMRLYAA